MARRLLYVVAGLALVWLGLHLYEQDRQIAALRNELDALRAVSAEPDAAPWIPDARSKLHVPPPAASSPSAPVPKAPAAAAPTAAPRAPVSSDEVARVESALLGLLESDRPELREKLRAVVQEQQETLEHEQRELRRERWISRAEERLAELSGSAALSAEQRQTILQIMLANRDQIADLMRSADTSEAFANARQTARRLREETDTRVRELLNPKQYEAFKQKFEDDDERRPPRGPARNE